MLVQASWMCCSSAVDLCELARLAHRVSADSTDWSSSAEMLSGRMDCWSWNVDAADAKKADHYYYYYYYYTVDKIIKTDLQLEIDIKATHVPP